MGQEEASSSSKGIALTCGEKNKMKSKQDESSSSSSSSSDDKEEDEDDDDDEESSGDDQASSSSNSSIDNEWRSWSASSMSRVCPSKLKIASSLIKEESKERKDAMDVAKEGTL